MSIHRFLQVFSPSKWLGNIWKLRFGVTYLKAMANRLRCRRTVFIGITGSAGKTTTKNICFELLSMAGNTYRTEKSRNAPFPVACAIAEVTPGHRYAVIEMGAPRPGVIDRSLRLVRPTIGALTNIGRDHYSAHGSVEALAREKARLIHAIPAHGVAVLNMDDPLVRDIGPECRCRVIWIGKEDNADIQLLDARSDWPGNLILSIRYRGNVHTVRTGLHGVHLAYPVLTALGIADAAGLNVENALVGLESISAEPGRMQVVQKADGVTFIRDDWKAPWWTFDAPLEFLKTARAERKIMVVGTLSDYAESATKLYRKAAQKARNYADLVVFVGPHAHRALRARESDTDTSIMAFEHIRDLSDFLKKQLRPGDLVLLKGSNKADHLIRLILDRDTPIDCWSVRCGRQVFCDVCPDLHRDRRETAISELA